jgi:DNA replication protein DnaC
MPFLFPPQDNAETLVDRLRQQGWWAEIIGPHGSGKSALLATLMRAMERAGQPAVLVELHDGQRRLPLDLRNDRRLHPPAVVVVDGYEQLSHWSRLVLKRFCRRHKLGLLVTAHEPVGFVELYRTVSTVGLAERIVGELLGGRESPCTSGELAACHARHKGDLRETLFELYDLYEERRS